MSPEIQEWSHKSRSRINNLYLLTRPIVTYSTIVHHGHWTLSSSLTRAKSSVKHQNVCGSFGGLSWHVRLCRLIVYAGSDGRAATLNTRWSDGVPVSYPVQISIKDDGDGTGGSEHRYGDDASFQQRTRRLPVCRHVVGHCALIQ